jgi:hypothetical protein
MIPTGWRQLADGEIRGDEDMWQDYEGSWHWCEISPEENDKRLGAQVIADLAVLEASQKKSRSRKN